MKFFKFLLVFLLPLAAMAGVSLKNGNFYISYTDILVPGGGHDLKVVRTYNSRATEVGWFGFGWGSDYETFITVSADGSVVVHENGSGALTRFTPKEAVDPTAAANKIIEAMRKKTPLSEKVASNLRKKLVSDAEIRQAYARKFNVKAKLASGTILYSNTRGLQEIHKVKKGFKRVYNDGKVEHFNKSGKLTKVKDKNGYMINFSYNKSNRLTAIKDSTAKQLFISWYADGKIKEVWSAGDKKVFYKYKGNNLIETKDIAGNIFKYDYDGHHNMTGIVYADGSKKSINYNKKTQFVTEVVDRNGESTGYKYDSNAKNPEFHYWTIVSKKSASGKKSSNRYEYEIKTRPDGSQYTYRIVTEINSFKTETIYSECCSLPLKITRGNHITTFEYNKKGLLTSKSSTKGDYVRLKYHKKFNKITRVDNNKGFTDFSYDKRGNLSKAKNSAGKSVLLIYDRKGRIVKMVDQDKINKNKKRILTFKYNALGKPIEIAMLKVGKINVAYDNYGEIKKVESKSGHKMALQVTQAFQSLLAIVKPSGVNLNM